MEKHLAARAEHIAAAEPGGEAARRLSDLTDEAVRDLARAASSRIRAVPSSSRIERSHGARMVAAAKSPAA